MAARPDVERDRLLAAASLAQLACSLAGWTVAVRRRRAYDLGVVRGSPDRVLRDSVLIGTAFSAPMPMLVAQAALVPVLRHSGWDRARTGLRRLGTAMVAGYTAERLVRRRLHPDGWDPVETPIAGLGLALAVAMAVVGRRH